METDAAVVPVPTPMRRFVKSRMLARRSYDDAFIVNAFLHNVKCSSVESDDDDDDDGMELSEVADGNMSSKRKHATLCVKRFVRAPLKT